MGSMARYFSIWVALLLCAPASRVLAWESVFPTQHQAHLLRALDALNLTSNDLGFKKDHGEPRLALKRVRGLMHNPLDAPVLADELIAAYAQYDTTTIWYALPASLLELEDRAAPAEVSRPPSVPHDL